MPQARSAGSSTRKPTAAKRTPAKPAAAKAGASKPAAPKSAAAKPGAKKAAAAKPAAKRTAGKAGTSSSARTSSSRPHVTVNIDAAQVEAIAERLRKLNEKIIEFGREAGESTLASYERALKTIATGVQQSPAKDELEWISHLAASQAKFVRELTDSWTKAARDRLK